MTAQPRSCPIKHEAAFVSGTVLLTPMGDRLVQDLVAGDMVETLDNGAQPVRLTRKMRIRHDATTAPVRFQQGVLGNSHDLVLAADKRIRFAGWQADLLFGVEEVMVPAEAFINGRTVTRESPMEVTYYQIWFDTAQIIFAERCPIECGASLEAISDIQPKRRPAQVYHNLKSHEAEVLLAL